MLDCLGYYVTCHAMATPPVFTVRLSADSKRNLVEMARVFGAPTVSQFAREILEVFSSGDVERARSFTLRLADRAGEQLKLSLNASFDKVAETQKPAKQARKPASRGKPAPMR